MKTAKGSIAKTAKESITKASPIKVCMHVLSEARTDSRVMREATALIGAGFAVSIVDVEGESNQPLQEVIGGVCLRHIIMPSAFISTRFTKWTLVRAAHVLIQSTLRLIGTPADIYHAHLETALPACFIAAQVRRKPLIFDAHELPLNDTSIRWRWLLMLFARLLAYILPRCAGVMTVSQPIAQEIQRCYRVPEVSLIRNISVYKNVPKSDRLRQRLCLDPNVRIALYQGNVQADRGLHNLIQAASFLEQDIVIVIMGRGCEPTQSELEMLIASEGVGDRVRMLPPVPYAELLDWTASADIGLIVNPPDHSLNVRMSLPNKLFEYLMAGLPVLSSQLDSVAEVIKTYECGQVLFSLVPADIGKAINSMLADRAALARMRRNALEASRSELNWEKESTELIRLYRDILARHKGDKAQHYLAALSPNEG